jgi:hypothetical protein
MDRLGSISGAILLKKGLFKLQEISRDINLPKIQPLVITFLVSLQQHLL